MDEEKNISAKSITKIGGTLYNRNWIKLMLESLRGKRYT